MKTRITHMAVGPDRSRPTPSQLALVTLAREVCRLNDELKTIDRRHRRPRPYEGSLYRELLHAVYRWWSYRRR